MGLHVIRVAINACNVVPFKATRHHMVQSVKNPAEFTQVFFSFKGSCGITVYV
jgi:hypothetical protein